MKINWFTVIAQIINFLILVWLLKRFLYKPVLDAIDEREKKIVAKLEDAEAKREEGRKEQDKFTEKNKQFDQQKKELMDKAIAETKVEKDKLLEVARNDANVFHAKQQRIDEDMQETLRKDLARKTQQEVFDISRKALADLASVSLEEQTAKLFITRLEELKDEGKKQFIEAFESVSKPVIVYSAFELQKKQQDEIKMKVDEILGKEATFQFKTAPEIISGIELTANGYKLSWSISAYLNSLQTSVSETVKDKVLAATNASPDKKTETAKKENGFN